MADGDMEYPRGSEWRQWDLHIHSPASYHWKGEKFDVGSDDPKNIKLIDDMIAAMNDAEPAAFALMDYWTFDGWFELKRRLAQPGAPKLSKTVFPGIELRLAAPAAVRLNAHVIFSDKIGDQHLRDFRAHLKLALINRDLSDDALIAYARQTGTDKLKRHGFGQQEVADDDAKALAAGQEIAELEPDSYKTAIEQAPEGEVVGFMPFTTYGGLENVDSMEHYAYVLSLARSSPIFETRDVNKWAAFAGVPTDGNKKFFAAYGEALGGVPRLAVAGSDAHKFKGKPNDNDNRGYGDFPSGKKTWIKADPTWLGLMHAIKEPAKRSFIGETPPKLEHIAKNKTFYIDEISISKVPGSTLPDPWLDGCKIGLNADLVAIIGNKGSGKSALADIIALLGNSQQQLHFSFLKRDRFRGKAGEPARQFAGTITWHAGADGKCVLSDDPTPDKVEMVKYIPQGRFEALCNDHVSGKSDGFEKELRAVIFTHLDPSVRLGALNFDQLIERQESGYRAKLNELRKNLHSVNEEISSIEDQLRPDVKTNLQELLALKTKEIEEHQKTRPAEVAQPTDDLPPEQKDASEKLGALTTAIDACEADIKTANERKQDLSEKRQSIRFIRDRTTILEGQHQEFLVSTAPYFERINLPAANTINLTVNLTDLNVLEVEISAEQQALDLKSQELVEKLAGLKTEVASVVVILNEPQQKYQKYLTDQKLWQFTLETLEGSASLPESKQGLTRRLQQIDELPSLLTERRARRQSLSGDIFGVLVEQTAERSELFGPLQKVIQENSLIREDYKLQFVSKLDGSAVQIADRLFEIVKQSIGDLRGEDESYAAVKVRFDKYKFENVADIVGFTNDINDLLNTAARQNQKDGEDIRGIMRKDRMAEEVYDHIYGLEYLEPRYTLLFQDTQIEQLSPGQRGALLLIFYLLVDRGRNPIVLDQPEENLDNETVVSLLVPVLEEAKKNRQIIMVTHNPNLAVVCDAEQIVYAEFARKNGPKLTYTSGSIENGIINRHTVDVLEGTKRAFDNRRQKYHDQ